MKFSKMHGAGNDFVVLDLRDGAAAPDAALCRALADRHTGVGCDQILTIEPPRSSGAIASYGIWNADGGAARQCGNGARCVAAWLVRDGAVPGAGDVFLLDSPAGTHAVTRLDGDRYAIAMGVPQFAPQSVPLLGYHEAQDRYALDVEGQSVQFGAVSMGNPHALVEVDDIATAPVATGRRRVATRCRVPAIGQRRIRRGRCARPHPSARVRARRRRNARLRQRRLRRGGDPDASRADRSRGDSRAARRRIADPVAGRCGIDHDGGAGDIRF